MPTNATTELRRLRQQLADAEWCIGRDEIDQARAEQDRDRSGWQIAKIPLGFIIIGVLAGAGAAALGLSGLSKDGSWAALAFLAVITGGGGLLALSYGFEARRDAPQVLTGVAERLAEQKRRKADAEEAIERLQQRQNTIADNTAWLTKKLAGLATATGWPEEDVERMNTVLGAVSDDLRARVH